MKILLSGNLGFIFSHVTEYLLSQGHKVIGIDALYDGSNPELEDEFEKHENFHQIIGDVNDIYGWLGESSNDFDVIIHAAAMSCVDTSIRDSANFIRSNVNGTHAMLEYARECNPNALFLLINTDEIYKETDGPATEETPLEPRNPYSASKACQAMLCMAYENTYNLKIREVRMCNIIGKRQKDTKLLPRVIQYIKEGKEIPVYNGGLATREYLDVRDVGPLLMKVINEGGRINNLSFNQEFNTLQIIDMVSNALGIKPKITEGHRPGHDMKYSLAPSTVCNGYNFRTIDQTIKWMLDEQN